MDELVAWLWDVSFWHWWALGIVLIAIEAVAPSTFLLWPAISAGAVGVVVLLAPELDWRFQVLAFAVLAVASTAAWQVWLRRHPPASDRPTLNVRAGSYVGRRFTLTEPLADGRGRLQVDDSWWRAESREGTTLTAGAKVRVVDVRGTVLIVEAES